MVKDGYAWHYKYYNKAKEYALAQKEAQNQKKGLWAGENPIPPYKYKRQLKQQK